MSNLVETGDKRARKSWLTQEIIRKINEGRKWKNLNDEGSKGGRKDDRRLRNELRRATNKAKKEYLENVCHEIMEFQTTGHYDLMYTKTKEVGWKANHRMQYSGTEDPPANITARQRPAQKIREN
jgi:hypothetical protein